MVEKSIKIDDNFREELRNKKEEEKTNAEKDLYKFVERIDNNKNKKRRKDTFGINEEEESYFVEDNLAYNGVMNNNNIINYNNNIINYNNNINNLNIQNLNMKSKSRKNSVESIRKFHGFEEGRLSVDMNDVLFQNIFEDEKGIKI